MHDAISTYKSGTHLSSGNKHTKGAHKNNDNNTALIFIGLNKTTQGHKHTLYITENMDTAKRKSHKKRQRVHVLKQMYLNVKEKNAITLEYFNLRAKAV
jgi:hypothetical protein